MYQGIEGTNNMNKIIITGHLGQDPELKNIGAGEGVDLCTFSVAQTEHYMKDGEKKSVTTWFKVDIFGKKAVSCEKYLTKGSHVLVEGKMQNDKVEVEGEQTRSYWKLKAFNVEFLSTKAENQGNEKQPSNPAPTNDDDIPF